MTNVQEVRIENRTNQQELLNNGDTQHVNRKLRRQDKYGGERQIK